MNVRVVDRTREYNLAVVNAIEKAVWEGAVDVGSKAVHRAPFKTGALKGSIDKEHKGHWAEVSANTSYALKMEMGGSRQAPEGYLVPSLEESRPFIISNIQNAIRGVRGSV